MGKDKQQPTAEELATIEGDRDIRTHEAVDDFDPTELIKMREFSDKVLEDSMWEVFFRPWIYNPDNTKTRNPYYSEAFKPLYLFFGRACRLGRMTSKDIQEYKDKVHRAAQRCYTLTNNRSEHFVIEAMEDYLTTVVPTHGHDGFFLKTIFEQKKTVNLLRGNEEKKGGWRLW